MRWFEQSCMRSQRELGRRCLNLWLQSRHTRHGGRNHYLCTPVGPGFHDVINVWNHLGFASAPKTSKNSQIFPVSPVIVDFCWEKQLKKHRLNKSKVLPSEGSACMGSAPPGVGTLPSFPPGHGSGLSWHFSKAISGTKIR